MQLNKNITDKNQSGTPVADRQTETPEHYRFDHWSFETETGDLFDGKATLRLEPQVARLLTHFLCHQQQVISRNELIAEVWDGRIVSDDAINRCVSILRQTLSPDDKQAYIETVVRKGYLAHFPSPSRPSDPAPDKPYPGRNRKRLLSAAIIGLAAIILYYAAGDRGKSSGDAHRLHYDRPPMVAVLPFVSMNQEGSSEFFAQGIHDDLLTQLAKLQSIQVISRTSVMEYRNTPHNIRTIGRELGVDTVLEGSVQIAANRIRINAQLIDATSDTHLWAETYDRDLSVLSIFDVQNEIARSIATHMNTALTTRDNQELALISTESMAAYLAYHRAMQIRQPGGGNTGDPEFARELEKAVELDPGFSRAWSELVISLSYRYFMGMEPDLALRAEQALRQLKNIAPGSADHLIGQAAYIYYALKDYDRSHHIVSRAVAMNPSNITAVQLKSWIERRQGNFDAFVESKRQARKLDPRSAALKDTLLRGLLLTRRYQEALAEADTSPQESFSTSLTRNIMLFREHRDFSRLQESMRELCSFYNESDCGWIAHIANRDYHSALDSLEDTRLDMTSSTLDPSDRRSIFTYWLMGKVDLLAEDLSEWRTRLDKDESAADGFVDSATSHIGLALLHAVDGNAAESELLIERWYRLQPIDWAERVKVRVDVCRILGMIEATQAAVRCIQDGLEEPSMVMAFLEPYLPFYDSVREEPEFIEMLAEIDGAGSRTRQHELSY